jgi:integrase
MSDEHSAKEPLRDRRGYRRGRQTHPGYRSGEPSPLRGENFPPEVLTRDDVIALMNGCDDTVYGLRLQALIAVLYRTGATMGEVVRLRLADVDLTPGAERAFFHGTKARERWLGLDSGVVHLLSRWLAQRSQWVGDAVFCVVTGPSAGLDWDGSQMRAELRGLGEAVLNRRLHQYGLRYGFAAEMMIEQWPLTYIQTQFGFSDVRSFRDLFSQLGLEAAEDADVAEAARSRPSRLAET